MSDDYAKRYDIVKARAEAMVTTFNGYAKDFDLKGWKASIAHKEGGPTASIRFHGVGAGVSYTFDPAFPDRDGVKTDFYRPEGRWFGGYVESGIKAAIEASAPGGPTWHEDDPKWLYYGGIVVVEGDGGEFTYAVSHPTKWGESAS